MATQEMPCACPPEAGGVTCERNVGHPVHDAASGGCPLNGQPGKPVAGHTIKALLAVSLRTVDQRDYRFCADPACPIVYFSADGNQTWTTAAVREPVYQKDPQNAMVWICYCFRHTVGDVQGADPATQHAILEDIAQGIQAGQCACDLRNPQGSCCLGNVRALLRRQTRT